MKSTIYISLLILTIFLSCCESQKQSQKTSEMEEDMNLTSINTYTTLSETRIKDELKRQDAQYIYDYEVKDEKLQVNVNDLNKLKALVDDESNFLNSGVIRNCSPNPEFFIEVNNETVYGFFLSSKCPTLFVITYDGPDAVVQEKSISNNKAEKFKKITNKIVLQ